MARAMKCAKFVVSAALIGTSVYATRNLYKVLSWEQGVRKCLETFEKSCDTSLSDLDVIAQRMKREMKAGLHPGHESCLKMLISFVDSLPDGYETGLYYALDLGGTNFRVIRMVLGGKGKDIISEYKEVAIPKELMQGTTEELFDFIATSLKDFIATEGPEFQLAPGQTCRELGFTFSFPVKQTAINAGTLIAWTKDFRVSGTAGKDVVEVLDAALKRCNVDIRVAALVNDTVGTLAGARYTDPECMIAVILGTGTNACYLQRGSEIATWPEGCKRSEDMVINMEWGNFETAHLPMTDIDLEIDKESANPGTQRYEKLISGMYLGEIVRRELVVLAQESGLFGEEVPPKLKQTNSLPTPLISKMHEDPSSDLQVIGAVLMERFEIESGLRVRKIVKSAIEIVVRRAARLAAAGIVAIVQHINDVPMKSEPVGGSLEGSASSKKLEVAATTAVAVAAESVKPVRKGGCTSIAVDGGLYEHYPKFQEFMHKTVVEMLEPDGLQVKIGLSKDGSGLGAALIAAKYSSSQPYQQR